MTEVKADYKVTITYHLKRDLTGIGFGSEKEDFEKELMKAAERSVGHYLIKAEVDTSRKE